jgi:hypothetical protein
MNLILKKRLEDEEFKAWFKRSKLVRWSLDLTWSTCPASRLQVKEAPPETMTLFKSKLTKLAYTFHSKPDSDLSRLSKLETQMPATPSK